MGIETHHGRDGKRGTIVMVSSGGGPSSPNGEGGHADAATAKESDAMGCVGAGAAGRCPYGLGTDCPLMETAQRALAASAFKLHLGPALFGVAISIIAVGLIHFR